MTLRAINPATEAEVGVYHEHDDGEVQRRLAAAESAAGRWRKTEMAERAAHLHRLAEVLRENAPRLAETMVSEMGKPIRAAESEVEKCAMCCDYFAENAPLMLAAQHHATGHDRGYVRFDPLGVVLAIMPWNFPIWQVIRFAAPGVMAGNVGVLKHAPNVPGTSLAIEEMFAAAGFPDGVFTSL